MAKLNINSYNTISELSNYEELSDITYSKMYLKSKISDNNGDFLIINSISLFNKYKEFIKKYTYKKTFTDIELIKYKYSPKLFCYDEYETPELWGLLLQVNNLTSCTEFNKQTILAFTDDVFEVINEILEVESDNINKNKVANNL